MVRSCALAASGQAAAVPPSRVMNSRRLIFHTAFLPTKSDHRHRRLASLHLSPAQGVLIHARWHEYASYTHSSVQAWTHADMHAMIFRFPHRKIWRQQRSAKLRRETESSLTVSCHHNPSDVINWRAISTITALVWITSVR